MFNFFRKKKDEEGRKKTKEPERPPRKTELKKMGNNHSKLDDEDPLKKSFNNEDRPMKETFQKPTEEDNTVKEADEISKISFTDVSNEEKPGDEQALSFDEDIMDADEEEIEELITEKSENPAEIMNDSRAKFFDDLLGGDTKVEASVAKAAPVETESPSDEEMISLRSIGLIESFPSIREEDEVTVKKKKHVHWADSEEGKCLESFNEFMTPSSSSEDEEELIEEQVDDDSLEEESEEESEEDDIPDDWREENETQVTENTQENEETESEESEESEEESEKDECTEVAPLENSNSDNTKTEDNVNKTDVESLELRILYSKLTEIQKDLLEKASSLERAQSDLEVAYNEADHAKNKIEKLEKELEEAKKRNTDLARRLSEEYISVEERRRLKDADIRVAELEFKLREMRGEREKLEASFSVLRMDRDKEIQNVKDALNAALNEKKEQEIKYQKEFENLRTLNSGREIQMLDDFEWKLREVEKLGKKKIAEAVLERDRMISDLSSKLEKAEADLEQLVELKACEIELKQLKVTSAEQRKNLRLIQRKLEDLQVNEMILQEEVNRLRIALDKEKAAMASLQVLHKEEIAEKERKLLFKLEYQKNQTNIEWEEKLKRESAKLKSDLERSFREEKMVAIDTAKRLKDQELANQRHNYEKKVQDLKTEIDGFKERLKLKENKHQVELQKAQTNTDREVLDKRRQLDKLDMTYQEKIEKLQEQYEKEISLLKAENEKKVAQIESGYQQQIGTTRTTLELVKQSMMDENQKKLENLIRKHEREMAEQWEKLQVAKEREIQEIQTSHRKTVELLQLQLDVLRKSKGRIEDMTEKTDLLVGDHTTKFSQSPFSSRLEPEGGPKEENFEENSTEDVQEMEGKDENQEVLDKSEKAKPHRNRRRNRRRKN